MIKQICLNLPAADLPKSKAFFRALGFSENSQFSGDAGAMIVINETISVMLATYSKFPRTTLDKLTGAWYRPWYHCARRFGHLHLIFSAPIVGRSIVSYLEIAPDQEVSDHCFYAPFSRI